jgi:hypothetical protein
VCRQVPTGGGGCMCHGEEGGLGGFGAKLPCGVEVLKLNFKGKEALQVKHLFKLPFREKSMIM